jgi:two-component system osmolarity sensor histidine kinase EnvZ
MGFAWLKRYFPRSLFGRAALILLVPIITIQLVVSYVFIQRLYENVTVQMTRSVLFDLTHIQDRLNAAPNVDAAQEAIAAHATPLGIRVKLPIEIAPRMKTDQRVFYDLSGRIVIRTLRAALPELQTIDLATDDAIVSYVADTNHGPARFTFQRNRVSASNPHQLLVLMVFVALIVTLVSFLFLRNQIRPIRRLAEAADAFGKGRVQPYRPSGATEVRSAGNAFLDMRARIERHLEQRTLMLSGVSHDLRTPLTRLKLGLSMLPQDEDTEAMEGDVDEMRRMLDTFLSFARSDATEEPEIVDPVQLVTDLVETAKRGDRNVSLGPLEGEGKVALRPLAIERALDNLIGNGVRYGTEALVSLAITEKAVRFTVEDNGPGIPETQREEAIKPFARLDSARNQNQSGVGLGLAIAAELVRGHGGTLALTKSDETGTEFAITLPKSDGAFGEAKA